MSEPAEIRDPVCGQVVDPLRARAVGIFGGVTRYFCSAECKAKYVDPRTSAGAGPGGVERRWQPNDAPTGASGEWFEKGAVVPAPARPDSFPELERSAPSDEGRPSPSLMLEVAASRRTRMRWVLVVALAVVGGALLFFGLRR